LDSETARDTGKGSHPTQNLKDSKNVDHFWPCFYYSIISNFFSNDLHTRPTNLGKSEISFIP